MKLKDKLDGKLPALSSVIWGELESLFLELSPDVLANGVTISVYQNSIGAPFYHHLDSADESKSGTQFSLKFDVKTLKEVIDIAEKNGLVVQRITEGTYYKFIYVPTWK